MKAREALTLTGAQIRMARACLRWSFHDLAHASGISVTTIQRLEKIDDVVHAQDDTLNLIRRTMESHGISFLDVDARGSGVRFLAPRGR